MSEMNTRPVLICKGCGKIYTFAAHTSKPDAEGEFLNKIMIEVAKDNLCADCTAKKSWYIQQNRVLDWEAGRP